MWCSCPVVLQVAPLASLHTSTLSMQLTTGKCVCAKWFPEVTAVFGMVVHFGPERLLYYRWHKAQVCSVASVQERPNIRINW